MYKYKILVYKVRGITHQDPIVNNIKPLWAMELPFYRERMISDRFAENFNVHVMDEVIRLRNIIARSCSDLFCQKFAMQS